jgi:hypothetical protein
LNQLSDFLFVFANQNSPPAHHIFGIVLLLRISVVFLRRNVFCFLIACFPLALSVAFFALAATKGPQPQTVSRTPADSQVVYVSDFDLDVVARKPGQRPMRRNTSASSSSGASSKPAPSSSSSNTSRLTRAASADNSKEITPADQANALINDVSESLIRSLHEAGYQAERLPAGSFLPKVGLRLRGVFAEADERNRARRLLIGGEPVSPNILLFVGVSNLSRPEQPLYALADPPIPDPRHGPVITVTSYSPAIRFELSREPSDEELNKISRQIAASLTSLLSANRLSFSQ